MIANLKQIICSKYKLLKLKRKFREDFKLYNNLTINNKALKKDNYPCLYDATILTDVEPIYFYQDAWAFERIIKMKPPDHIDIGSSHKFVSLLSKLTNLTMVDIRPLALNMDSINFKKGDVCNLPFENESVNSLSSLCAIEHIGLGRYGDKIDPEGSEKAFKEINRILKSNSNFYFSVPVERNNKVYFNAHRSFNEDYLFKVMLVNYEIIESIYIYEQSFQNKINANMFGIGCYHVRKK